MHPWIANLLIIWQLGLMLVLALYAWRAGGPVASTIAISVLGPLVTATLALVAAARAEALYLDIALVVAMLGVAQTLTVVRTAERDEEAR